MNKKEALEALNTTHTLWKPEYAVRVAGYFGLEPKDIDIRLHQDNRSKVKGLMLYDAKEGAEDFGVDSLALAEQIAGHLGVANKAGSFFGRGSQQRAYAEAIEKVTAHKH